MTWFDEWSLTLRSLRYSSSRFIDRPHIVLSCSMEDRYAEEKRRVSKLWQEIRARCYIRVSTCHEYVRPEYEVLTERRKYTTSCPNYDTKFSILITIRDVFAHGCSVSFTDTVRSTCDWDSFVCSMSSLNSWLTMMISGISSTSSWRPRHAVILSRL